MKWIYKKWIQRLNILYSIINLDTINKPKFKKNYTNSFLKNYFKDPFVNYAACHII